MKRKTTKEILAESFRELAALKPIDKITIQDITDNCGYSPATFYRNFRDKYDLIAWDYTRDLAVLMDRIGASYEWKEALIDGTKSFYDEKDYLANLFQHTSGHDSFVRYMTEIHFDALKRQILKASDEEELSKQEELCLRLYCLGSVGLTCEWIFGLHDATIEDIADIYLNSLPAPLHQYFL